MERRRFVKGAVATAAAALVVGKIGTTKVYADDKTLNRLTNKKNPSMLEKKHVPLVKAPKKVKKGEWFDVEVKVGFMVEHPSTPEHFIDSIKLLMDGNETIELENERGGNTSPNGYFRIRLNKSCRLEAIAECNLHGRWLSEPVNITVE